MKNIILYDSICKLCDYSIGFIIKHDRKENFYFVSIGSSLGKELILKYDLKDVDSLILISNDKAYIYSDGVLNIAKGLDSWHRYLYIFRFIPKKLRDIIYRIIAKYRYRIFGKKTYCTMPNPQIEKRFLD